MKYDLKVLLKIARDNRAQLLSGDANRIENDVLGFIMAVGLKSGQHEVVSSLIYDCYLAWSKHPKPATSFFRKCNEMVAFTFKGRTKYLLTNLRPGDIMLLTEKWKRK